MAELQGTGQARPDVAGRGTRKASRGAATYGAVRVWRAARRQCTRQHQHGCLLPRLHGSSAFRLTRGRQQQLGPHVLSRDWPTSTGGCSPAGQDSARPRWGDMGNVRDASERRHGYRGLAPPAPPLSALRRPLCRVAAHAPALPARYLAVGDRVHLPPARDFLRVHRFVAPSIYQSNTSSEAASGGPAGGAAPACGGLSGCCCCCCCRGGVGC